MPAGKRTIPHFPRFDAGWQVSCMPLLRQHGPPASRRIVKQLDPRTISRQEMEQRLKRSGSGMLKVSRLGLSAFGNGGDAVSHRPPIDWRRRMSDNVAYALLVYTALQIFVTMGALEARGGSLLPYFALVVLVVAIIPACRLFEARWSRLDDTQAADPAHAPAFRRDRRFLWLLATGLPFVLTGLFRLLALLLD